MSKNKNTGSLLAFICCLLFNSQLSAPYPPVMASGGGSGAISPPRPGARDVFTPTKASRGTIIRIDEEKNTITFKDTKDREITLALDKKIKYRAEDALDFGGRKELNREDLKPDLDIRIVYRESDKTAVEVKILKKK